MTTNNSFEKEVAWLLKEKYNGIKNEAFYNDKDRLTRGEPLAYIIGWVSFLGTHIDLSYKPLIPRIETEFWVEKAILYIKKTHTTGSSLSILDIFSGSGCIGMALLKAFSNAEITFSDNDDDALAQIKKNIVLNALQREQTHLSLSDCFSSLPEKTYDFIFANPPYLSKKREEHIQPSVLMHEPHQALFADDDGLFFMKKIMAGGKKFLNKKGVLFIELDPHQKEAVSSYAQKCGWTVNFWTDQFECIRVAILKHTLM